MSDWLEFEAFSLVRIVLINGAWIAGLTAGYKAGQRWNKWIGWSVGITLAFALFAFFYPVIELVEARTCQIEPLMEDCY